MVVFCCLSARAAFAQARSDSADTGKGATRHPAPREHSIQSAILGRTDSLQSPQNAKLEKLDSLQNHYQNNNIVKRSTDKVDSIQARFYQRSDSLKNTCKNKLSKLDAAKSVLQKKLDSLNTLKIPANHVTAKLDSLNKIRDITMAEFDKKLQSIKDKTITKLKTLDLPPEATNKLNAVTKNIEAANISNLNIPTLNGLSSPLDKVNEMGQLPNVNNPMQTSGITEKLGDINAPNADFEQLTGANESLSDINKGTGAAGEYSEEAKEMAKGNFDKVKNIPKTAEEKATQVSGIKEIEEQTKGLHQYKDMTGKAKDPDALKKEALEKAKQTAVNHFAGKEEQLKAAMEKISKYKQKYSNVKDISELPKRPPNEMRDKPLIERIVPGLGIQFQKKGEDLLVDLNPYAGYRFTGRIKAGLGWNQRIAYDIDKRKFSPDARIYGPRAFGEFRLGKGFYPRAEIEVMNTRIPPMISAIDPMKREWVWGAFLGIKKEYKLFKGVKGTAMVMARLINPSHKSPYAEIVNARFGFEFPMKKKIKPASKKD